jgi:predicted PurR-regulated permease PerM
MIMLGWGVIISTSDNFLRPILVSRYAPVSAFTVFVGVVGGIGAFGTIGIVVGPVFLALVSAILQYFDEKVIAPNKRKLDAQAQVPPPKPGL